MIGTSSVPQAQVEDKKTTGSKTGGKKKNSANPKILSNSNKKNSMGGEGLLLKANSL